MGLFPDLRGRLASLNSHGAHREGTAFLEDLVARSLESIRKARN